MRKRPFGPIPVQVLKRIASRIGATILLEPDWQTVGQITFKNGKKSYFWNVSFDINPLGASVVADDKVARDRPLNASRLIPEFKA